MPAARIVAALTFLLALPPLLAAPLFEDSAVMDATLEGPLAELMRDAESREQLPFVLRAGGTEHAIRVRVRGKSRLRVCDFLPLRLNFKKSKVGGTVFAEQDKLKLVVPCQSSERAEKNLLEEYAVYRLFNLLTPASYRVRLLRMTFTDTSRDDDSTRLHAFLLEPGQRLAERLGGQESERTGVSVNWL